MKLQKPISNLLNTAEFPIEVRDGKGRLVYFETANGHWYRIEFDDTNDMIYYEDCSGMIIDRKTYLTKKNNNSLKNKLLQTFYKFKLNKLK